MRPSPSCSLLALLLLSVISSCKKEHNTASGPGGPPSIVYVLGVQNGEALYWKNGTANTVSDETGVLFNFGSSSLAAAGNNVYVAGFQSGSTGNHIYNTVPSFWLNGTANTLFDSTGSVVGGSATGVAISGSDVYLAGTRGYDSDTAHVPYTTLTATYPITGNVATVWKNGTPVSLPNFSSVGQVDSGKYTNRFYNDYVSGIDVSGTNVYVAGGSYYSVAHARYWVNGNPEDLTGNLVYTNANGSSAFPTTTSIYASGADVYVTGSETTTTAEPLAIYWKNGSPFFLSTDSIGGSTANAVFVSGSNVYIAGWQNIGNYSRAILWKNGVAESLTSGNTASVATSVFVYGNDVYVAGYTWVVGGYDIATYWKNGVPVKLTDGTSDAIAWSISVQ
jgi:hypothetical protein